MLTLHLLTIKDGAYLLDKKHIRYCLLFCFHKKSVAYKISCETCYSH